MQLLLRVYIMGDVIFFNTFGLFGICHLLEKAFKTSSVLFWCFVSIFEWLLRNFRKWLVLCHQIHCKYKLLG